MESFRFRIILADVEELVDDMTHEKLLDMSDAVYEAGCDDSSPAMSCGVVFIDFDREAKNLREAIETAVAQIESAGYRVLKVVSPDQRSFDRINEQLANRAQPTGATNR